MRKQLLLHKMKYFKTTLLLLLVLPIAVQAKDISFTIDGVSYCVDPLGRCYISEVDDLGRDEVVLPASIAHEGVTYTVTAVNSCQGCKVAKRIVLPQSIEQLEMWTFYKCGGLEEIVIPDNIASIRDFTLAYCPNLHTITFGRGIKNVAGMCAVGCPKLRNIVFKSSEPPVVNPPMVESHERYVSVISPDMVERVTLHVPAESLDAYKDHYSWKIYPAILPIATSQADMKAPGAFAVEIDGAFATFSGNSGDITVYNIDGSIAARTDGRYAVKLTRGVYLAKSGEEVVKFQIQ